MRFPIALLAALSSGAMAARAQSAPANTRIDDIQVSREGETVSILVKLSSQPVAASAKTADENLTLEIDGVMLARLQLTPPSGAMVTKVEASGKTITLSGAAFGKATTVIYRNAVLIETKLADPELRPATSLMAATPAAKPAPAPAQPIAPQPIAVAPPPAKPQPTIEAKPHTPPPAPAPLVSRRTASLAGIDAARCAAAEAELAKDAWALAALGDHALCLLDAGKTDEAKNRLDQLAAITPQDWRVALGRAALDEKAGDSIKAQAGFVAASLAAPNDSIRSAITAHIPPTGVIVEAAAIEAKPVENKPAEAKAVEKDLPLQLPIPSAKAAVAHH